MFRQNCNPSLGTFHSKQMTGRKFEMKEHPQERHQFGFRRQYGLPRFNECRTVFCADWNIEHVSFTIRSSLFLTCINGYEFSQATPRLQRWDSMCQHWRWLLPFAHCCWTLLRLKRRPSVRKRQNQKHKLLTNFCVYPRSMEFLVIAKRHSLLHQVIGFSDY